MLTSHLNDPLLPMASLNPEVKASPELQVVVAKGPGKGPGCAFPEHERAGHGAAFHAGGPRLAATGKLSPALQRLSSAPPPGDKTGTPTSMQFARTADPNADTRPENPERGVAAPAVTSMAPLSETRIAIPKRASPAPWIAAGVVVIGAGAAFFYWRSAEPPRTTPSPDPTHSAAPPPAPTLSAPIVEPTGARPRPSPK